MVVAGGGADAVVPPPQQPHLDEPRAVAAIAIRVRYLTVFSIPFLTTGNSLCN